MAQRQLDLLGLMLGFSGCACWTIAAAQSAPVLDVYGSLRTQVESVSPDRQGRLNGYTSVRDAYSRLGIKSEYPLNSALALTGQLEIPIDSGNLRIRDPYDQGDSTHPRGQRLRIAQIGLRSNVGSFAYGHQWMPYYNAIAAPVDMFSSYYTGFATYTIFRAAETISYSSPEFNGFSLAAAHAGRGGNRRSTSRIDDRRWQVAATYLFGATRIAAAVDDRGDAGYGRNRLYGLSASHKTEKAYLAIKYEVFDTGNRQDGGFSTDGNHSINLFGSYVWKKNTMKLMLAKVENYGDIIVHLGIDHVLQDNLKIFAEYYRESESAALTTRRRGLKDLDARISGGHAIAVGVRYDF
jgi:predicted porin